MIQKKTTINKNDSKKDDNTTVNVTGVKSYTNKQ